MRWQGQTKIVLSSGFFQIKPQVRGGTELQTDVRELQLRQSETIVGGMEGTPGSCMGSCVLGVLVVFFAHSNCTQPSVSQQPVCSRKVL